VAALCQQAIDQAREDGNLHQHLAALEVWLTLIDPADEGARRDFRRLLAEVNHSDAPVLTRWRTLLDRSLPYPADATS
ncbi:hypothetical protein, partial [uncultured Halomonas sp.]|uniref:hypothetical protein n=1 Tax=uncultured Halomonas sp. TaxID=173971 RepID=UPI00260ABA60